MRFLAIERQQGIALVSVLAVVAVMAMIATGLIQKRSVEIVRTQSIESARVASSLLQGVESHLLKALSAQRDRQDLYEGDGCRSPRHSITLDSATIEVQLENLHCRFNINAMGTSAKANALFVGLVDRLTLEGMVEGIDGRVLSASIAGWKDGTRIAPYRSASGRTQLNAGQRFRSVSELALLPETRGDEWRQLARYLTALPTAEHGVDVSTAPSVLKSAIRDTEANGYDGNVRFVQADLSVLVGERIFHSCAVMDLEASSIFLREQLPCLR